MRRKEKHIVKGIVTGVAVATALDILFQWIEHEKRGQKFTWDSYNGKRTLKRAAFGGLVGGTIGYGIYLHKISEESKLPFNSDEYVKKLLTTEHLKSDTMLFGNIQEYREKLKEWLRDRFKGKLAAMPEDTGSFNKGIAINSNFDLDIILPFKKTSYNSLEEMYYDVLDVIDSAFKDDATVRKHSKAIGITFENNGNPISFDIVPGREINNYLTEKDLNLYVRPDWVWQKGSSFKTNVLTQQKLAINKPEVKTVIKLLKIYRDKNGLNLPSVLVDQYVTEALEVNGIYKSSTENLLNCMDYISKKLQQKNFFDVSNTNNNLHDKVAYAHREYISNQLLNDIYRIEENPRYIKEIFET